MRRALYISFLAMLGLCASVGLGYWLGVRDGLRVGVMAEFGARGALAAGLLPALRNGKTDAVITTLEFDVDNSLLWSHELAQWPHARYLEPLWGLSAFPVNDRYVVRAAQYRGANPSPFRGIKLQPPAASSGAEARALHQELERQGEVDERVIAEMVDRYGKR